MSICVGASVHVTVSSLTQIFVKFLDKGRSGTVAQRLHSFLWLCCVKKQGINHFNSVQFSVYSRQLYSSLLFPSLSSFSACFS